MLGALGIALAAPPATAGEAAVGITQSDAPELVLFNTDSPGKVVERLPVTGLLAAERVLGLDLRPASGELFALSSQNRVLAIDPESGRATQLAGTLATNPLYTPGSPGGIDFNPTVDRLRLVNAQEDNLRFNPITFLPVDGDGNSGNGLTPDTDLAFAAGDANAGQDPAVVAVAYSQNDNDPATPTTLFGVDSALDIFVRQGGLNGVPSPNLGQLFTLGNLALDIDSQAALDIVPGASGGFGTAYLAAVASGTSRSTLYEVPLPGGVPTTPLDPQGIVAGDALSGLAVLPAGALSLPPKPASVSERKRKVTVKVGRIGETLSGADGNHIVRVPYRTVDRTALAGRDYTAKQGILRFEAGQRTKGVTVRLRRDGRREADEVFALVLGPHASGGAAIATERQSVRIVDDD